MSNKTKNVKSENVNNVRAEIVAFFASNVENYKSQASAIQATIDDKSCSDVRDAELKIKNLNARCERMSYFAMSVASDDTFANAFMKRFESANACERLKALAIYAQDKVYDVVAALARNVSLSAVTRNNSTLALLRALSKTSLTSKLSTAELMTSYNANANVSSTQTSSSVQALRALNVITTDSVTKAHSIADSDAASVLAA